MEYQESDYPNFPPNWDIDNKSHFQYYKKCFPYVNDSKDFDNYIKKSTTFYIYGMAAIIYFTVLSIMLIKHRNHYLFKRQGRIYFLFFILGSIINSINSYIVQVFYYKLYIS